MLDDPCSFDMNADIDEPEATPQPRWGRGNPKQTGSNCNSL
ncbi:MAG: hypothetical protein VKL59_04415 [Nostocaceae cyanobacterium]|nr:hypothetical protein [Nostocaceae cyanobacterium]